MTESLPGTFLPGSSLGDTSYQYLRGTALYFGKSANLSLKMLHF
jgi:hypothetical protein